jgi:S-adenosylmethionine:tRNA ribosyltransferase-isomerase
MRLSDFDYPLPKRLIAQAPAERRDASRLLVYRRATDKVEHACFATLPEHLLRGTLLVVNDTRVMPARLRARKPSGGAVELLVLDSEPCPEGTVRCLVGSAKPVVPGQRLELLDRAGAPSWFSAEVVSRSGGEATVHIAGLGRGGVAEVLETLGEVPLPPYIVRDRAPGAEDADRYQTVYARAFGAVAAPTAGLHFTPALLEALRTRGHEVVSLTLHIGPGTFAPVRSLDPRQHEMHPEIYSIPPETASAILRARAEKRPVLAVGTTVVRALEAACHDAGGALHAVAGAETRLFIYPGWTFRVVDAMLTNFHLPRSTLLMLVSAFVGRERVLALYAEAIAREYRFFSYGDAMLLWP